MVGFEVGACTRIVRVEGDMRSGELLGGDVVVGTECQIVVEGAAIGVNGRRSQLEVGLQLQPHTGRFVGSDQGVKAPAYFLHLFLLSIAVEGSRLFLR